jgi:nucleotide-binding universal stress UspA family protein
MIYSHILVAVEHSAADATILAHAQALAKLMGSRMTLVHVADGWAARNYDALALRESEEMKDDRAYLDRLVGEIQSNGISADSTLAKGDPATEIVRVAEETGVDLIAMATHGHRFLADMLKGATADRVRHLTHVPVLMLRHQARAREL